MDYKAIFTSIKENTLRSEHEDGIPDLVVEVIPSEEDDVDISLPNESDTSDEELPVEVVIDDPNAEDTTNTNDTVEEDIVISEEGVIHVPQSLPHIPSFAVERLVSAASDETARSIHRDFVAHKNDPQMCEGSGAQGGNSKLPYNIVFMKNVYHLTLNVYGLMWSRHKTMKQLVTFLSSLKPEDTLVVYSPDVDSGSPFIVEWILPFITALKLSQAHVSFDATGLMGPVGLALGDVCDTRILSDISGINMFPLEQVDQIHPFQIPIRDMWIGILGRYRTRNWITDDEYDTLMSGSHTVVTVFGEAFKSRNPI